MRRQLLATLAVAALCMASYAASYMHVKTTDGNIVKYDVGNVEEVNFINEGTGPITSNHTYVDLGLTSGSLWATYNIGATKPEEFGDYFAWGETEPKEVYDWSTYKYAKASGAWDLDSLTKYNSGNYYDGVVDNLSSLLPEDDAATANWGKEWRIPTTDELDELIVECEYSWTEVNGVYGAKFTGKNGNSVFFPAAGCIYGSDVRNVGFFGFNWSFSLYEEDASSSLFLAFDEEGAGWNNGISRSYGYTVRAVRTQK